MTKKKNNKGIRVISYGLVSSAWSAEKNQTSPNGAKVIKHRVSISSSNDAARDNNQGNESKEEEALDIPKSTVSFAEQEPETRNNEPTESPKSTANDGQSADNLFSVKYDQQQPETGHEEESADDLLSIQQDPLSNERSTPEVPEQENERASLNNIVHIQPGTNQKCMACEKTVYLVDKLTADNRVYHKSCFRCHHCKRTLKLGNYNSFEGVLYCKPHFDQLFKRTGSLDKSFEGTPKIVKQEKTVDGERPASNKLSFMFAGTRERCVGCNNTVYPTEKVTVNGTPYHRSCFKCSKGGCTISPSNYIAHEGTLYCKHHHTQLIKEKGNLSQLEADIGKDQVKETETVEAAA